MIKTPFNRSSVRGKYGRAKMKNNLRFNDICSQHNASNLTAVEDSDERVKH